MFLETLNHHSWLDHFFVSEKLYKSVLRCIILDDGANLSDHLPMSCTLSLSLTNFESCHNPLYRPLKQRWDKADLMSYYYVTGNLLQSINLPSNLLHCSVGCACAEHHSEINQHYNIIVDKLS